MIKLDTISKSESARYMGIRGVPDDKTAEILDRYEPIVRERLRPAFVYRETAVDFADDGVHFEGVNAVFSGNDIRNHLAGCERAVLLAVTVSAEADKLIRQTSVTGMAEALAVDCLCSSAIEQVCNKAEAEIFAGNNPQFRTWRFSPGYGDLPITLQKELILALNAQRRIGLTVTDSFLLIPSKSVTAIIGISDKPIEKGGKGCSICNMRDRCGLRLNGGCGKN
ncbi:MAG: 5-methyltetrahydrofolate--homocysteine methyltransferase [Ruminococcus flavefaciens]|nr:5-methyltetrahydrofolate--homocysteine methyltransferase [Ruminococcus flavefaciens]MCM1228917.1 5-methyltetrahydrofolate--homocysteine methyltransferase [Ruminococcus flavefaciens]